MGGEDSVRISARTIGCAPALLLGLACAGPARAAVPTPFTGSFSYTHPVPTPVPGTSLLLVVGTFEGRSNLGPFTGTGTFLFDVTTFSYTGDFRWDFTGGSLRGSLSGQDYPVETPDGYLTTIALTFTEGAGWFRGAFGLGAAGGADRFDPEGTSTVRAVFAGTLLSR
jgi:hypothetical protein